MAPRALASGTISFGLVAIPVKLFTTTENSKSVQFNMVHESCGTRVKYKYFCPTDDRMVERNEIAKGYEFVKGQYVLFSEEELKALQPESTGSIEITEFVPLSKVDPIYYEKAYYLGPDKGGAKPYKLLSGALEESGRAALGQYSTRGKMYLVLIRPFGADGLLLQQLRYADDLRAFDEVPLGSAELKAAELKLALQLIEQGASDHFKPQDYKDEARDRVWKMIERKVEGEEIVAQPEADSGAKIVDLMEALKASLAGGGADEGKTRKPPQRAKAAKKKTAKKARAKRAAKG